MLDITSQFESVPQALKLQQNWIVRNSDKVPFTPVNGNSAKAGVPDTWGTFEEACKAYSRDTNKYAGIGYQFDANNCIVGIDLDHCHDMTNGTIDLWAQEIITRLASYTEYSPNDGVHIFVRGSLPDECRHKILLADKRHPKAAIEIYDRGRYFTITGKHLATTPLTLTSIPTQDILDLLPGTDVPAPTRRLISITPIDDDQMLLDRAMKAVNGAKFQRLWNGDTSDYADDESQADSALCTLLAFWTQKNAYRIDQLFRRSGLMREKWDRNARSGEKYGEGTIARAIAACNEVYDPHRREETINAQLFTLLSDVHKNSQLSKLAKSKKVKSRRRPLSPAQVSDKIVLELLEENEYGDAKLFARMFEDQIIYDRTDKQWYIWGGHYWIQDAKGQVPLLISGVLGGTYLKANAALNIQLAELDVRIRTMGQDGASYELETLKGQYAATKASMKVVNQRVKDLRGATRNKHVQEFIQSLLPINSEDWDNDPWLLAVENGVIDLHTGQFFDGDPQDYIKTFAPVEWNGLDAPCERFMQFLQEIFEDKSESDRFDIIQFLHKYFGYGITGLANQALFLILYGAEGRNGKDTLLGIIQNVLGKYAGAVSNDVFIDRDKHGSSAGAATPHIADLQGKRLVWGSETKKGDKFDSGTIKKITGNGSIPARRPFGQQFEFMPSHTLLLMTNDKPHADPKDKAFWSRTCLVEFNLRFVDVPQASNERKADISLQQKIADEASGIIAWLVRGCLAWQHDGLEKPECVVLSTKNYQDEENVLHEFIEECCVIHPNASIGSQALYDRYKAWISETNTGYTLTRPNFYKELSITFEKVRLSTGFKYQGIGLYCGDDYNPDDDNSSVGSVGSVGTRVGTHVGSVDTPKSSSQANLEKTKNQSSVGSVGIPPNQSILNNKTSFTKGVLGSTYTTYTNSCDNLPKTASQADEKEPTLPTLVPTYIPSKVHGKKVLNFYADLRSKKINIQMDEERFIIQSESDITDEVFSTIVNRINDIDADGSLTAFITERDEHLARGETERIKIVLSDL